MTTNDSEGFVKKYDEMYVEATRLKSFKNWPFGEDAKCSATKMAEAGFYHCPTDEELDLVQCYVCFKELDGWDSTDEPWDEHLSHSKQCVFAQLKKPQNNLTAKEVFQIEKERKTNKNKRVTAQILQELRRMKEESEEHFIDIKETIESERKNK